MATSAHVDADIATLVTHIQRLGTADADGIVSTTFGDLFRDDTVQNTLESLAGTLKAAKRKKFLKVSHASLVTQRRTYTLTMNHTHLHVRQRANPRSLHVCLCRCLSTMPSFCCRVLATRR